MATMMHITPARQPFAPLDTSRLQTLTSLKNRQNALQLSSPSKRKAAVFVEDDAENVDPSQFASPKRSKAFDGLSSPSKPSHFVLTKASTADFTGSPAKINASSPLTPTTTATTTTTTSSRPSVRPLQQARSPATNKINTSLSRSSPLTAPAGRSPTRKRAGLLNRRKTASSSPFTRVDPPRFGSGAAAPFSIDAALSGTIPGYGLAHGSSSARTPSSRRAVATAAPPPPQPALRELPDARDSWFFDIHEDTAEELMTNLMEHSTCTLDISSGDDDDEVAPTAASSAAALRAARDLLRGKENVPPLDDVSQTSRLAPPRAQGSASAAADIVVADADDAVKESAVLAALLSRRCGGNGREAAEGAIDVDRAPLGDLAAGDFYAEGCDASTVVLVLDEAEEAETDVEDDGGDHGVEAGADTTLRLPGRCTFDFAAGPEEARAPPYPGVAAMEDAGVSSSGSNGSSGSISNVGAKETMQIDETVAQVGSRVRTVDELMAKSDGEAAPAAAVLCPMEKAEEGWTIWESGSAKGEE